ncbi:MAG: hypothetical protein HYV60_01395, partial [Planctomycetia bacterium]|nr:hypothetical protein [Planctomycetia bacterium]
VGLTTILHLLNGPLLNRRLRDEQGRLSQLVRSGASTERTVEEFYIAALGRIPTNDERTHWLSQLETGETDANRQAMEDFVWGLLNSREFLTNH